MRLIGLPVCRLAGTPEKVKVPASPGEFEKLIVCEAAMPVAAARASGRAKRASLVTNERSMSTSCQDKGLSGF
jgi:hypothetical protein